MEVYTVSKSFATPDLAHIPPELGQRAQWVAWREEYANHLYDKRFDRYGEGVGRPKKKPYRLTPPIEPASTSDAGTWGTYQDALALIACANPHATGGVGFVLTEGDPLCCLDFDGCRNPKTGEVHPEVVRIIKEFDCYAELSPSGTGLHVWGKGKKPGRRVRATICDGVTVEIYDANQFVTVTGNVFHAGPVQERQEALNALYGRLFPEGESVVDDAHAGREGGFVGTDEELLNRARGAKTGAEFTALHDQGDLSAVDGDHSRGDFKLCRMYAYWCGPDVERINRLFRRSALYREEKWNERHRGDDATYGQMTIEAAIRACKNVYRAGRKVDGTLAGADVQAALDAVEDEVWRQMAAGEKAWKGKAGNTNVSITATLVSLGRERGEMLSTGCVILPALSIRGLADEAKVSAPAVMRYAKRIKPTGLVRQDAAETRGLAGAFVLVPPKKTPARNVHTSSTRGMDTRLVDGVYDSRAPVEVVPLRYSVPGVHRTGKGGELVVRLLHRRGVPLTPVQMEDSTGIRASDLRRRILPELKEWGVVTATPRADLSRHVYEYDLSPDYRERLEAAREYGGEPLQDEAQRALYAVERAALDYHEADLRHARKPSSDTHRRLTAAQEALTVAREEYEDRRKAYRDFLDEARMRPAPEAADARPEADSGTVVVLYPDAHEVQADSIPSGESFGETAVGVSHESPDEAADHRHYTKGTHMGTLHTVEEKNTVIRHYAHESREIPVRLAAAMKRDDPATRDHPDGCGCLGCETLLPDLPRYANARGAPEEADHEHDRRRHYTKEYESCAA